MIVIIYVLSLMCKSSRRKTLSGQLKHSHTACMVIQRLLRSPIMMMHDVISECWQWTAVGIMEIIIIKLQLCNILIILIIFFDHYYDHGAKGFHNNCWRWSSEKLLLLILSLQADQSLNFEDAETKYTHTNTPTWTMKAFVGWRSSTDDDKCRQRAGDGWSNNVIHWGSLLILRSFTITIEVIASRAEDAKEEEGEDQCNIKHCMHRRAAKETYISWRRMNLTAIVFILVYAKRNERFVFSFLPSFRIYILSKGIDLSISEWVSDCFSARGGGSLSGLINWFK